MSGGITPLVEWLSSCFLFVEDESYWKTGNGYSDAKNSEYIPLLLAVSPKNGSS